MPTTACVTATHPLAGFREKESAILLPNQMLLVEYLLQAFLQGPLVSLCETHFQQLQFPFPV